MANIDRAFSVPDGLSLNDVVGVFHSANDPTSSGEAAPVGSLLLRTTGQLYLKTGASDTQWSLIGIRPNVFSSHNAAVTQVLSATFVDLLASSTTINDSSVFTNNSGRITVSQSGTYFVDYSVTGSGDDGGFFGTGSSFRAGIYVNDVVVPGSFSGAYTRADAAQVTASNSAILNLTASNVVSIKMQTQVGTFSTVANSCSLKLIKVR